MVHRKDFAVSLSSHARFCHALSQKIAAFYTYINLVLNIFLDSISFSTDIQYLKVVVLDRVYNPSIVDEALFKLQNLRLSHPFHSNFNSHINVIIPYFSKFSFSIVEILKNHSFKEIFTPINKVSFQVKDLIDALNSYGICNISCQCGLSYLGQTKHRFCFHLFDHKDNVRHQEINKSAIAKHCCEK